MMSSLSLALRKRGDNAAGSTLHLPPSGITGSEAPPSRYHPAPSRNEVAILQPVIVNVLRFSLDLRA